MLQRHGLVAQHVDSPRFERLREHSRQPRFFPVAPDTAHGVVVVSEHRKYAVSCPQLTDQRSDNSAGAAGRRH